MPDPWRVLEYAVAVIAVLIAFIVFCAALVIGQAVFSASARAHSFYPFECCSGQDCWPMGRGEREPDPVLTPQGWRLHDGEVGGFAEARPSPDGRFHVCRRGGAASGAVIRPGRPCLWVPVQGS